MQMVDGGKRLSFLAEVRTSGSPKFYRNGLRFATADEAERYARGLAYRWTSVVEWRVTSDEAHDANARLETDSIVVMIK